MSVTQLPLNAPDGEPTAELYKISPPVATRWLQRNVHNRPIRLRVVAAYCRDMMAGNWQITGEAIKFDATGALLDGQHRLRAVIMAGVTVPMLVVRGLAPESQNVMDSGVKRSASDPLSMEGRKDVSILVSAARLAMAEPGAGFVSAEEAIKNPTNSEIAAFVEEFDDQLTNAAAVARHVYRNIGCTPSVLAVAWMRLIEIDSDACTEFFNSIAEHRTDGAGDPRLALMRRLQNIKTDRKMLTQAGYLSLLFRTWNAWRAGKKMSVIPTHIGDEIVRIPDHLR